MSKALVVLSGGQDSTACLFYAINTYDEVEAITFNYGQRHLAELDAAKKVAAMAGVAHEIVEVGSILRGTSPLVSGNELEQYASFDVLPGGLEKTFVPGRNLLFLTLAANIAYCKQFDVLVTGVCQEDFGGYPDCRQTFITAVQDAINTAMFLSPLDGEITIDTPLMDLSKAESIKFAQNFDGCFEALAYTHTAYDGAFPPVGHDHATLLRAKGFYEAGLPDPLVMRANSMGLMPLPETSNYDSVRG